MAYGIGPISGCHVNPAVSFGVLVAGRMTVSDFISYVIAQVLGAIAGAVVLYVILSGKSSGWTGGLGQNGWGTGYLGQYNLTSAFVFEVVCQVTFIFLVCILGVTPKKGAPTQFAGLAIGLDLGRDSYCRDQRHRCFRSTRRAPSGQRSLAWGPIQLRWVRCGCSSSLH